VVGDNLCYHFEHVLVRVMDRMQVEQSHKMEAAWLMFEGQDNLVGHYIEDVVHKLVVVVVLADNPFEVVGGTCLELFVESIVVEIVEQCDHWRVVERVAYGYRWHCLLT